MPSIGWKKSDSGDQAVALDGEYEATEDEFRAWHKMLKENVVKIVPPHTWKLVNHDVSNEHSIVPSAHADSANEHFDIITWTLGHTGPGLDGW